MQADAVKPTYQSDRVTLYLGDCLDVLPTLAGVDAVVTDPPYGISYENKRSDIRPRTFAPVIDSDGDMSIGQAAIDTCFSQEWPVCTFAHHRSPWQGKWRQWLVWDKGPAVGGGGDIATCWKFTWELIQFGGFGRLNGQRDSSVLRFWIGQKDSHNHPCEKPLPLILYLLGKLTENPVVLDPFMGSGTTGVAAVQLGRRFIGVEIDPAYYAIAERRIRQAEQDARLFDPPVPEAENADLFSGIGDAP